MSHLAEHLARMETIASVVAIDFSPVAVAFMRERAEGHRQWQQKLRYHAMDVRGITFGNNSFDLIIDEGLLGE